MPPPGSHVRVEVQRTYHEQVLIPGQAASADSTVVTMRMHVTLAGHELTVANVIHLFAVDGRWRWAMQLDVLDRLKAGRCPSSSRKGGTVRA